MSQLLTSELLDSPKQEAAALDPAPQPATIDPVQSLELRLRWLEALLYGVKQDSVKEGRSRHSRLVSGTLDKRYELKKGDTLIRSAEEAKRRMDGIVEGNDGLRRFMDHYEQHAALLTPAFALSGTLPSTPPAYQNMSPSELEAFLAELEPDIRAADKDMREIDMLEKKGVTAAGKLPDYEPLQPRLEAVIERHHEDVKTAAALEKRVASIMKQYASQVDNLSELFVAWDEAVRGVEEQVARMERDRDERIRLGYE
ncbi:hypothetical protein EWM64_g3687 [Hericium alpestre]|uniref:Uncharacterized protein n=1 Tax=Hericium alpestre TaxID=135208 RepID=A0A4Z0A0U1_9AGAM|nr:hypothetical protein EWM64_g3687 [Hericium alpestre]